MTEIHQWSRFCPD